MDRVFGAVLLIAGSCIGAGMLALPVVTGIAGFFPAIVTFLIGWLFMTTTAFLLLEVNIWLGAKVSIVSMSGHTLGKVGKALAWILFCYMFYLVLVAYTAASGKVTTDFFSDFFGAPIPQWVGSVFFTAFFGLIVFLGTVAVDRTNRVLMFGLGIAYLLLIGMGSRYVHSELLMRTNWAKLLGALPVMVFAFGFHNMIPSINRYLQCDPRKLRLALGLGSLLPLAIYLVFEWVILGILPAKQLASDLPAGELATHALLSVSGSSWVAGAAQAFAFFALVTSFVAQALSLVHFLADGLKLSAQKRHTGPLVLLALIPPLLAALWDPNIFITALELAAAFGAVTLFGIMPALMVWSKRYHHQVSAFRMVPGGRPVLVLVILISIFIMGLKIKAMVAA